MNRKITVLPKATSDTDKAIAWYDRQAKGLGQAFLAEVNRQVRRIRSFPFSYPKLGASTRRAAMHRFPYVMIYRVLPTEIEIVAVFPCRTDPAGYRDDLPTQSN